MKEMVIADETLVQQVRERLAEMARKSNPTPLNVHVLSQQFNTTVPRVTRALRYLEKLKNEIRREKAIAGTPIEILVFPKMFTKVDSKKEKIVMQDINKPVNNSQNRRRFVQDEYSYRNVNTNRIADNEKHFDVSVSPVLKNTFTPDAQNSSNRATNEIGDFLPVIVDYGMLLTYKSQQKKNMGLVVNSVTIRPEAAELIQESLRCFNALDYVYERLDGTQRRMVDGILKGVSTYGRFTNYVSSDSEG
ncbi:hypothetical protein EBR57_08095 [bacterium]|nr:hypothetical protein [bacterium]